MQYHGGAIHGERLHLRPKDLSVKVDKAGDCAHEDPQGLRLRQRHPGDEVDVHGDGDEGNDDNHLLRWS